MIKRSLLLLLILALIVPVIAQDEDCEGVYTIAEIQTVTDDSICQGDRVFVEDVIVTAVGIRGFFIQTPDDRHDDNPLTSEGIYVFTTRPTPLFGVQVGDRITVEGRVKEEFNFTRLEVSSPNRVEILSSGNDVPEPIDLMAVDLEWTVGEDVHPLERYEGMLVSVLDAPVVAPTNYFDEFGISLTGERAFREAGVEIDLDPQFANMGLPQFDLNPELIEIDPPEMGMDAEFVPVGSRVAVDGGLAYSYQDYQIWTRDLVIERVEEVVRSVRPATEDEFTIATQNVLNLFDLTNDPRRDDSTSEDYVPDTTELYQIRLRKLSEQIRINLGAPDIVAIQEIENARALTDLAFQIYSDDPSLRYYGCIAEGNDGRGIDNAYLVNLERVNINSCERMDGTLEASDPTAGLLFGRPPLILEAELLHGRDTTRITLINLHVKSLSGDETDRVQQRRAAQAAYVAGYVQGILLVDPEANVVVLGDLNAFEFSDGLVDVVGILSGTHNPDDALVAPDEDLLEPNLINQVMRVPVEDRYSYIFNSTSQVLDHILTTPALDALIVDAQFSRGNADALYTSEFEDNGALRSSDHDGFVIYINPAQE